MKTFAHTCIYFIKLLFIHEYLEKKLIYYKVNNSKFNNSKLFTRMSIEY